MPALGQAGTICRLKRQSEHETKLAMIYSTQGIHPRERLSYWREVATRGYVEHDFRAVDGATFTGSVQTATLPGLGIATFDVDPAHVSRSDRSAARSDSNDLIICMQLAGRASVSQDGNDAVFDGRGIYMLDPMRPFETALLDHCDNICVKIEREMLEARIGNTAGLTARPIKSTVGVAALTMGFLELLPAQAESLDDVAGLNVANQLVDLLALTFTASYGKDTALSSPRAIALLRLKAIIERLLIEPGLKPERIASEAGISVRYANALLAEENWSIERYVNERRLVRCSKTLADSAQSHRSIGEIAFTWGFSDLSHFGRRFKARYGVTPTEFRRHAQDREIEQIATEPVDLIGLNNRLIREIA
jgi:AraC family transcriptional activator of tynA and feaB